MSELELTLDDALLLVRAMFLRVHHSTSGNATIDLVETEAVKILFSAKDSLPDDWMLELTEFGLGSPRKNDKLSADEEDEGADEDEDDEADEGDNQDEEALAFGIVGLGPEAGVGSDFELDFNCYNEAGGDNATLCIDFGTAMSKAFAMSGWSKANELPIGKTAGGDHAFMVESSVWIDDDGIFFGPDAMRRSEGMDEGRARFDSMKSHILKLATSGVSEVVPESINPHAGDTHFTELGLMVLYLAYVNRLVFKTLESAGLPGYLKIRVARPCWTGSAGDRASELLKLLMAKSMILADTFKDELLEGLDVNRAAEALQAVDGQFNQEELDELVKNCIDVDIAEPEAVAAPFDAPNDWHYMTVVDVGAGTSDVATFLLRFNEKWDRAKVRLVECSEGTLAMAGDHLDRVLVDELLSQFREMLDDSELDIVKGQLAARAREFKETLFRDEELDVDIDMLDASVHIDLEEFLNLDGVKEFAANLEALVAGSLSDIPKLHSERMYDKGGIKMLFTGGGAGLSVVTELAEKNYTSRGKTIHARIGDASPDWLIHRSADFKAVYPQLAVAAGGASPDLPERN